MRRLSVKDAAKLALCIAAPLLIGAAGGLVTAASLQPWYDSLHRPAFTPPSWVFGPVWTALYILMGIAAFIVWQQGGRVAAVRTGMAAFAVQLILNAAWTPVFFGLHSLRGALVVIVLLWVAIVWTIILFRKVSALAAWMLAPYLLWTTFAGVLNAGFCVLNR